MLLMIIDTSKAPDIE
ncbi:MULTISPECIES: hypothetical protein [Enterobacter]|nr:hypothetical protein [Enterobacter sp. S-33]